MITKKLTHSIALTVFLAANFTSSIASAQQSGERPGPPPEAIEACASQTEGAACSFTGPRGDATGSCMVGPQGAGELACRPAGGPQDGKDKK